LLAANNHLKILDLSLNHLGRGVAAFADNTCLVDLDLSFNKVPARAAIPLAKNSQLKKLNLSHNKLGALDAIALAGNTGIEELILSSNKVGEIGAAAFINNSTLISLSLNYNNVQDKAAVVLAGHPTLLKLELATNGLTPACAAAFEKNSILEYLNLSHNKIGDAVGLALAKNHQYRVLGLHGTGITDATVLALADNNHLIMLDAGGNPMLTAISAKVVSQFDALVSLDLSGTKITDDGVGYFADHPSMRQLSLVDSHLSDRAAYALTQNTVLSEVHLDFNDISVSGGIALHGNLKIDATTDGSSYNTDEHEPLHSVEDQAKLDEVDPLKRVSNARALGALAPLPSLVDLSMFAVSKAVSEDKIQLDSSVSHIVRQHSHVKMKK
jgi:Leucine-rich repeat (LRR) protein